MKTSTNKQRIIIATLILIALLTLIFTNYKSYLIDDKLNLLPFLLSILISIITSVFFSVKIEINNKFNKTITIISFISSIFLSYIIIELLNKTTPFLLYPKRLVFNFIIIIFLHLFIYSIFNKISLSIFISNSIIFILGTANYIVTCFRGTPLVPWDILSIKTAMHVAETYTFTFSYYFILAATLFFLILSIGTKAKYQLKNNKANTIFRIITILIILFSILSFYRTNIIDFFDFENNLWKPKDEYRNNGFLASFLKQSKNLINDKPENYSLEEIENILQETKDNLYETAYTNDKPNIIVIMNESYCDLSVNR